MVVDKHNYQKTAKDIAFEREKNKLRHQISQLKSVIVEQDKEIKLLHNQIENLYSEKSNMKEWIERLCDYVNLSENELKELYENEKNKSELVKGISTLIGFVNKYPYSF